MSQLRTKIDVVQIAQSAQVSAPFIIYNWAYFLAAYLPTFDAADVGLQVTTDGGSTWTDVIDQATGAILVLTTGVVTAVVDFGDYVRAWGSNDVGGVAQNALTKIRFKLTAAQTTADVDIEVTQRG